nr:GAF and ANTAR domain-containing protein [Kibdelosporangium sp. MJ126-NF4]CEL15427.1 hypothetical protein [Kibdelosporangium sp. MJ126-NF4]CTQ92169.1 hypothetical protein [Kibdelosporangium sp. MJ126-NF4]
MPAENLAETFVRLADTLVADFDAVGFMYLLADQCVTTLEVGASGILLADHHGDLQVIGASSEQARLLELFEVQHSEGPCAECYRTKEPVTLPDLRTGRQRWPGFSELAVKNGFLAVHALPMRLRSETIGALNLFSTEPGLLSDGTLRVAQAMADVATIGLLQARVIQRGEVLAEQLQRALHSRVLIEQAKGVLSERLQVDVSQAFEALRRYARERNLFISAVAESVINGELDVSTLEIRR